MVCEQKVFHTIRFLISICRPVGRYTRWDCSVRTSLCVLLYHRICRLKVYSFFLLPLNCFLFGCWLHHTWIRFPCNTAESTCNNNNSKSVTLHSSTPFAVHAVFFCSFLLILLLFFIAFLSCVYPKQKIEMALHGNFVKNTSQTHFTRKQFKKNKDTIKD